MVKERGDAQIMELNNTNYCVTILLLCFSSEISSKEEITSGSFQLSDIAPLVISSKNRKDEVTFSQAFKYDEGILVEQNWQLKKIFFFSNRILWKVFLVL